MPRIKINNLSKSYSNGVKALKNVNIDINDKEFVAIIGPSGCGKSTLLEIVAGLQKSTDGEILLDDVKITTTSRDIGVVFQDSSLFPWRSVQDNIAFGLEIRGLKKSQTVDLVQKYVKMVNLTGYENLYPHQLSGGMRQRAGIARTLINNPKVLLMDEPFGAVDHLTRLQLQDEITDIWQKDKKTVIFITHDVMEAVYLADKVILLTSSPGMVKKDFVVPFLRPRLRNNSELVEIEHAIYKSLNDIDDKYQPEYTI